MVQIDTVAVRLKFMLQYRLSQLGLGVVLAAALFSGAVNNGVSAVCVGAAALCWLALGQGTRQTMIALAAMCGWLLLAAMISVAYRIE